MSSEINSIKHEEIIEYCDGYSVTWKNRKFYVKMKKQDEHLLNYTELAVFKSLEEALHYYNTLIEKKEL